MSSFFNKASKCNGRLIPAPDRSQTDIKADYEVFSRSYESYQYEETCQCGKVHYLETQKNDRPEYLTNVYLKCVCGNYVKFLLPVN